MKKKKIKKVRLVGTSTQKAWFGGGGTYFKDSAGFRSVKAPFKGGGFK
jgi:hypothetical protein